MIITTWCQTHNTVALQPDWGHFLLWSVFYVVPPSMWPLCLWIHGVLFPTLKTTMHLYAVILILIFFPIIFLWTPWTWVLTLCTFYGENQITLHCGNRTATLCMLYSPCVQICNLINYTLILLLILPFSDMCSALWKRQQREFKCSFSPAFLLISDRDGDWSLSFDLASVNEIFFSFTSFKVLRLMRVWSVNFSYKDEM